MSLLQEILREKKKEVTLASARVSLATLREKASTLPTPLGFAHHLTSALQPAIIAEIKRASPSKGVIREDLNEIQTAKDFQANGCACLSVLTDQKFFQGSLLLLPKIREVVPTLPILRKDFIIDSYQVWETRAAGADALLLIAAALDDDGFIRLYQETRSASLDILCEVHTEEELERVFTLLARMENQHQAIFDTSRFMLGVNNRDLNNFRTDLAVTKKLIGKLPTLFEKHELRHLKEELLIVSESGIETASDIVDLLHANAKAFLIGESLVRKGNPGENLRQLIAETQRLLQTVIAQ